MLSKAEHAVRACAKLEREINLRDAETSGAWVIRRSRFRRIKSLNERDEVVHDALSCLHGVSYTMQCKNCRRSESDAESNLAKLKLKLSIT